MQRASEAEMLNILDLFGRLDVEEYGNPGSIFRYIGLLDVHAKRLSEEEAASILSSELISRNENKFENYFRRCVQSIPGRIFVKRCPIIGGRDSHENIFKIEESDELMDIIKQIAREECFYNIYFVEAMTVVVGNFDLSWPIYSFSEDYRTFNQIAREVNLYIRNN
ncbi:hypothetical protein ACFRAM_12695 [Paenibacillus sp. NPDC056722]|uniref:hypothetical protein n=1 Tax=Paenibacillus sp. NPDC056722 TaxID=3345924 RepID=UPI003682A755